ncbi:hypothetical protein DBR06_SOUSAS203710001, partial [Sousa chinensis]
MWLRLLTGLGHCACEPPHVMSRLRLWLPRLFLTWLQLWLQVQAVQPPEWALGLVQVTPNPPRLTEAWSSYASDPPPKLPHALTPLAEAGGFNYLTSWSPFEMLAPPHRELTEAEAPYPDTDSASVVFSPEHPVPTVSPLGQDQAQLLQRPDVSVKPVGLALIVTPAFTNELETPPPQQETSAQSTVSSEQLEPLSVWQEFSEQHPIPSENVELFPVHQGAPIQPPYPEVTFPNPEQVQARHPTLIEATIQPLDLGLTR